MLKSYTFHLVQLGVLKETLVQLPEFRPGGVTPEQITTMLTAAETKQMDCLTAESNRDADRGELEVAQADAHAAAVAGFAQMKSAYRNVPKSLSPIKRLPTRDKSPAETVIRMQHNSPGRRYQHPQALNNNEQLKW